MSVPVVCALFLTAIAAYFDWRWQKIPNLLALTGWVIGAGLWMGFRGFRGLSVWALGALIPGLAALAVCRLGAVGAGDVKLISALGAILSYKRGLWVFLAAGVLAVVAGIGRYMQKGELHLVNCTIKRTGKTTTDRCFYWAMVLPAGRDFHRSSDIRMQKGSCRIS